jgi:hypothetical protein
MEGKDLDNLRASPMAEEGVFRVAIKPLLNLLVESPDIDGDEKVKYRDILRSITKTIFDEMEDENDWSGEHFATLFATCIEEPANMLAGDVIRGRASTELYDEFVELIFEVLKTPTMAADAIASDFAKGLERKVTVDEVAARR